ncbi:MAG: VapC toxin family PIN domain ribonuclease [Chloroflexi bacterium]|jgi:predicted nucleic acid-binding protein|nr:VapC toxin family PIN domain ribonuclease [Chloroflexota bacterium]MCH2538420.1 PIN domain-containing protein [Dehalococcoidia bacterium]HIB10757.1 PIN domain-containing protein [Dehalococcoidia bacterium]HIM50245.1 PIN domain-containing protein [Dehalococcoidia bacterium]
MTAALDTSFVVRYMMGSPADSARQASEVIDSTEELEISGIALAETAFVLTTVYQVPRGRAADQLIDLVRKENISLTGLTKDLAIQGLLMCRPSGRVSIADALIWAAARSGGSEVVYSFDRRFPDDGLEVRTSAAGP